MNIEQRPHDSFFRSYFFQAETMQGLLEQVLPAPLLQSLDLKTLQIDPASYLDEAGRDHYADIAASVSARSPGADTPGTPAAPERTGQTGTDKTRQTKVYLLLEHKSWYDARAHLQILRYMVQTWEKELRDKPGPRGKTPPQGLSPILPVLFYHGPKRRIHRSFRTLLRREIPPALIPHQPAFDLVIYNLTALPDDRIGGPPDIQAALYSLKYARDDLARVLRRLNCLAREGGVLFLRTSRFHQVLLYLLHAAGLTGEELREKIQSEVTDQVLREDIMSTAQLLKMEGHQEGLQEGIQKGLRKGRHTGKQEEAVLVTRRLLAKGMTLEEIAPIVDFPLSELRELLARED